MHSASFRRAQAFFKEESAARGQLWLLGIVEAVLALALLVIVGLMLALTTTPAHTYFTSPGVPASVTGGQEEAEGLSRFPRAVRLKASRVADPNVWDLSESGLVSVALRNLESNRLPLRLWGAMLRSLIHIAPGLASNKPAILILLIASLVICGLLALILHARVKIRSRLAVQATESLRNLIHRQIYRLGQTSLPAEGTGPVIGLFTREVNDVRVGLEAEMAQSPRIWVLAAGLLIIPLLIAPELSISLISLWALVTLAAAVMIKERKRKLDQATRESAVQLSLLQEDLGLLRTVRVHGMEHVDKLRFDEHLARYSVAERLRSNLEAVPSPYFFLLIASAALITFGWLSLQVVLDKVSEAGALMVLVSLVAFLHPVRRIYQMRKAVDRASRSASGIFEFLEKKPEMQQNVGASFLPTIKTKIAFDNVSVVSMAGRPLLSGVSFTIPAGGRVGVMGMEDESKYALACMIPRLLDPKSGKVKIDGMDVRDVTLESLRAQVSTVLQADLVFSDSVLANIGLGDPSYDLPRIVEAAKIAHAHNFIIALPNGYDTIIGPLGHYLSRDEQYRIALARAFLHDPSIVIIEEPAGPHDDDVKHLFDDTIERLSAGKTMIFLPHRLSTIRKCDQILLLHEGKVDAIGPPRELQANSRLFRHIQYLEFNQFAAGGIEVGQMAGG